jgi:hypothetical protein
MTNAQKAIDYLDRHPTIDAAKVGEVVKVSPASAYKSIVDLVQYQV